MSKTHSAARKAPTHFETVPLEVVKEIAVEVVFPGQKPGAASGSGGRPARKRLLIPVPARAPAGKKR